MEPSSIEVLVPRGEEIPDDDDDAYQALAAPGGAHLSPGEAQRLIEYMRPLSKEEEEFAEETPFVDDLSWVDDPAHTSDVLRAGKGKGMDQYLEDTSYGETMEKEDEYADKHDTDTFHGWNRGGGNRGSRGGGSGRGWGKRSGRNYQSNQNSGSYQSNQSQGSGHHHHHHRRGGTQQPYGTTPTGAPYGTPYGAPYGTPYGTAPVSAAVAPIVAEYAAAHAPATTPYNPYGTNPYGANPYGTSPGTQPVRCEPLRGEPLRDDVRPEQPGSVRATRPRHSHDPGRAHPGGDSQEGSGARPREEARGRARQLARRPGQVRRRSGAPALLLRERLKTLDQGQAQDVHHDGGGWSKSTPREVVKQAEHMLTLTASKRKGQSHVLPNPVDLSGWNPLSSAVNAARSVTNVITSPFSRPFSSSSSNQGRRRGRHHRHHRGNQGQNGQNGQYGQYGSYQQPSSNPYGANPYGANPNGTNPDGTAYDPNNPSEANPYGANPYGANPYGANPYIAGDATRGGRRVRRPRALPKKAYYAMGAEVAKKAVVRGLAKKLVVEHANWLADQDKSAGVTVRPRSFYENVSKLWTKDKLEKSAVPTSSTMGGWTSTPRTFVKHAELVLGDTAQHRKRYSEALGFSVDMGGWTPSLAAKHAVVGFSLNPMHYVKQGCQRVENVAKGAITLPQGHELRAGLHQDGPSSGGTGRQCAGRGPLRLHLEGYQVRGEQSQAVALLPIRAVVHRFQGTCSEPESEHHRPAAGTVGSRPGAGGTGQRVGEELRRDSGRKVRRSHRLAHEWFRQDETLRVRHARGRHLPARQSWAVEHPRRGHLHGWCQEEASPRVRRAQRRHVLRRRERAVRARRERLPRPRLPRKDEGAWPSSRRRRLHG